MRGSVFIETLKTSWASTLMWGLGMAAFMWFFVLITPAMKSIDLVNLFGSLPEAVLAMAGIQDISLIGTTTGLLAFGFFGKMALLFAVYPAFVGMRVTATEEDSGILDVVLSLPVPRWQMLVEKFLAYSINIVVLILLVIVGLLGGLATVTLEDVETGRLILISLNLIPVLILVLAVTIFIGAFISRKQLVLILVTVYIIASYSLFTVGSMISASWMDPIEALSFFSYYNVEYLLNPDNATTILINVGIMLVVSAVLLGGSIFVFERRDIAV